MFGNSAKDLATIERTGCKSFKTKKLGKRKMETFTSKVIDLTQPKLQTIWNVKKRGEMDKIIAKCFLDVRFLLMSSNQIISNK
jgi:hypothetical protein